MQNEGIKQTGFMALFAEGAVVNGKWPHTSPSPTNPFVSQAQKPSNYYTNAKTKTNTKTKTMASGHIFHLPQAICQSSPKTIQLFRSQCFLEIYFILSPLQPVTVNQGNAVHSFLEKPICSICTRLVFIYRPLYYQTIYPRLSSHRVIQKTGKH